MQGRRRRTITTQTELGRIEIADTAIASLAAQAVLRSYGVVGLALPGLRAGITRLLGRNSARRGVVVTTDGQDVLIDLYVVLESGLRISEVANNIRESVQYAVERALGRPVKQVNVHIQGLRVGPADA
ncbi:MAG TPA: Asp23/Gls24 family envelope stress response protein [Ardenticatenaceae bacterium]|nr:Asp23/Gls24 family envelope stress response protein [Ardenticatenaceae bacterium]